MYTSILLFAVAGLVPGADATAPTWQTDYNRARQAGAREQKPLAVVLGNGRTGYDKLNLDDTSRQLLADQFIPVYVDTATPEGQKLAQAFNLTSGQGLVLSDRSGQHQAFWHEGTLANPELVQRLQRVASLQGPPQSTETQNGVRTSFYPSSGLTGQVAPAGYLSPAYSPLMQPGYFGGYMGGGGCPNCRR